MTNQIRGKLTNNKELNELLGMEMTDTDSTDVCSLINNLQLVQSQRDVALTYDLSGVHAGAAPLSFH